MAVHWMSAEINLIQKSKLAFSNSCIDLNQGRWDGRAWLNQRFADQLDTHHVPNSF